MELRNKGRVHSTRRMEKNKTWRWSAIKLDTRNIIIMIIVILLVVGFFGSIADAVKLFSNKTTKTNEVEVVADNTEISTTVLETTPVQAEPSSEEVVVLNLEYAPIINDQLQPNATGAYDEYVYDVCNSDKILLAKLAYAEARGESLEGIVAVVSVVLNRYVDGGDFNNVSIYSVITQRNQFADISGITEADLAAVPKCMEAVELACKGWDPTRRIFPNGAHYFYNPDNVGPTEAAAREGVESYRIGHHIFHDKFKKS